MTYQLMPWRIPLSEYLRAPALPGIYLITHVASGRRYVGRAVNLRDRFGDHAIAVENPKNSGARKLGNAIRKYGAHAFVVQIVNLRRDLVGRPDILEQLAIDERRNFLHFADYNCRCGAPLPWYNVDCRTVGGRCGPQSRETREKISVANRRKTLGVRFAPQRCANISAGVKRSWGTPEGERRKEVQRELIEDRRPQLNAGLAQAAADGRIARRNRRSGRQLAERQRRSRVMQRNHATPEIRGKMYQKSKYEFKSEETRALRILNIKHMRPKRRALGTTLVPEARGAAQPSVAPPAPRVIP